MVNRVRPRLALPLLFVLFTVIFCVRFLPAQQQTSDWKSDPVLVFMHRSACMVAPENTVPALEAAVKQGADGIEIDIRRTRDGAFVLYHDDWVLRQYGTTGKIENLTLAETQQLDVGERWGPQWKGLHPPLFEDVLRFARANDLRLFFDIKTPGIYTTVLEIAKKLNCMELVYTTGGQVPQGNLRSSIPWIRGWNYTDDGEEDPARMRAVLTPVPKEPVGIMCDDARSIVRALGRHPERRPFKPFVSTIQARLKNAKPSRKEGRSRSIQTLLKIAESNPNFAARQNACWQVSTLAKLFGGSSTVTDTLLRIALRPIDAAKQKAGNYEDTFLKIAAACALARLQSAEGRKALRQLMDSPGEFNREAAAFALGTFGMEEDIYLMRELADEDARNAGTVASVLVSGVGRLGAQALPVYEVALSREDVSKVTVFGLAALGAKVLPLLEKTITDERLTLSARRRAVLALTWISNPAAARLRLRLAARSDLPAEWADLLVSR